MTFESAPSEITCLNCATVFHGNFCPECGQKAGPAMPTTKEVLGDLLRSAMSPSGKMFETLKVLVLKPGELTRAYLAGQRMRYVHPVRVYLLCVFVFVAIVTINNSIRGWMGKLSFENEQSALYVAGKTDEERKQSAAYKAGLAIGKQQKDRKLPEWIERRLKEKTKQSSEAEAEKEREKVFQSLSKNYSGLFAAMVPFMALINWMLYAGRGFSYAGHFIFMLHSMAVGGLIQALPYIVNMPALAFVTMLLAVVWAVIAGRRAFGVSYWGSTWRVVLLYIPTMIVMGIVGMIIGFLLFLFAN